MIVPHLRILLAIIILSGVSLAQQETSWEPTGPYGGSITALAINSHGYIFAGTTDGGIFLWQGSGDQWTSIFRVSSWVSALALDRGDNLYAALSDSGVYQSKDNGTHWVKINDHGDIVSIAFNNKKHVFLGSEVNGILVSRDSCLTWERLEPQFDEHLSSLVVDSKDRIFAASSDVQGRNGISFSSDDGLTWEDRSIDASGDAISCLAIRKSGELWAARNGWEGEGGVYRSRDQGKHWNKLTTDFEVELVGCIEFDHENNIFIGTSEYGAKNGLYVSTDNGSNWTERITGLNSSPISSIVLTKSGQIFVGSGNGVQASFDHGNTWKYMDDGISALNIKSLAVGLNDDLYAGAEYGRVFRSTDNGAAWQMLSIVDPEGKVQALAVDTKGNLFAATDVRSGSSGSVYRSSDHGVTWETTDLSDVYASAFVITDSGQIITYGYSNQYKGGKLLESLDEGEHWRPVDPGLGGLWGFGIFKESNGILYATTDKTDAAILKSTDNGKRWDSVSTFHGNVATIAASNKLLIVGGYFNGLGVSLDGGNHFALKQLANNTVVYDLLIDKNGIIFAGSSTGVYESTDHGNSWIKTMNGFVESSKNQTLVISPSDVVFAGTKAGVYRRQR